MGSSSPLVCKILNPPRVFKEVLSAFCAWRHAQKPSEDLAQAVLVTWDSGLDSTSVRGARVCRERARCVGEGVSICSLRAEAGGSLDDVATLTTFIRDMSRYADFAKVGREFFQAPYPANIVVEVSSLIQPGLLIEIEAVAAV
jgi:hypothetical protein